MDPTRNSRQKAFKKRMREAGKRQVAVWATDEQATAIKQLLEGVSLPAQPSQTGLDDLAARETALAEREKKVARLEMFRKLDITQYELNNKALALDRLQKELDQRRLELGRKEKALGKRADAEKISFGERRKRLIDAHTTRIDIRTGEKKVIDTAWSAADQKKIMADLSRKTRVASNTIRDVMVQFGKHDLLSEREKAALDLAKAVLTELAEAAGEAKDTVSAHEKRIREEEQARERAARIAVENSFDVSQAADLVAVLEWLRAAYDLRDLRDDVIKGREFNRLYRIRTSATNGIAGRIASIMNEDKSSVAVATKKVRAELAVATPAALEKHAGLIRDLNTVLVAARLETANASDKGKKEG